MAENVDFNIVIENDENTDTNEDNNSEVNDIPSGQIPRNEIQIAEDTIRDINKLNKQRYPLLTLVSLMKYQKKCNTRNGVLNVSFKGSVGAKENSEITDSINNAIQTSKDTLYASILETLTTKISDIGRQLNQTYSENMEIIGTETAQSGEARTRLSSKSKDINEHFTHKLKVYTASLKPRTDNQPYKKRAENQSYQKKTWTTSKPKADKHVLRELQDLVAKLNN
ncbi:unnamed protein product [Mytilus edulis]|uniref:Uncharacterized protein n=1 Tax=Mytilus edulis TaxID=6550 RepID=A0A8S3SAC5_MYTED|nr:unnamed protein product [Mytilus edulis]